MNSKSSLSRDEFVHSAHAELLLFLLMLDSKTNFSAFNVDDCHGVLADLYGISNGKLNLLLLHEEPPEVVLTRKISSIDAPQRISGLRGLNIATVENGGKGYLPLESRLLRTQKSHRFHH